MSKNPKADQSQEKGGKKKSSGSKKSVRKKGGVLGGGVVLTIAFAIWQLPSTIIFLAGLLPSLVVFGLDKDKEKTWSLTIGSMNFCGVLYYAMDLWMSNYTVDHAQKILANPMSWGVMYGSAAVGYFLFYAIPPIAGAILSVKLGGKIDGIKKKQKELVDQWGEEVSGQQENNS
ncbi:MAG: hypothetical protein ACOYK8_10320 [Alphaproteobacteria bacterium]